MPKLTQRWLLLALLLVGLAVPAAAQIRIPAAAQQRSEIREVLHRAEQFETQRRWGEALSVYEDALRDFPHDSTLGNRHNLAKIHYDLARRYNDSSFLRALSTIDQNEALNLYSEVLSKIETHHVATPQWKSLVARGTQDLQIALYDETFKQQHMPGKSPEEVSAFNDSITRFIEQREVRSRQQAVDLVRATARYAQERLGIPATAVALEFSCAAIGALDSYSAYLTSDQLNDVYSQIEGNFVGLGIELKADAGALLIVNVITGSPADRAGIRSGDRITEVDGQATAELTTDQAADLLQGPEGSVARILVVNRENQGRRLSVRREHVEVPSVDDVKIVDPDFGIGYMKLTCFQKTTSRDLDAALWKLHRQGMRSLIIDLRGNPGGLLTASVEVADKFIAEGTIVSTRGRSPLEDYNYTAHKAGTWRVPLVVLIDGDSASASEIFAGAIRDHRRGNIVGQRSYGKGSVQGIFPLAIAGSGVRLTTAKFYSPNGQPISHVGVQPDIVVHQVARKSSESLALADDGADSELSAAIQAARRQTAQR
ncbi:MAG: S41 family peptidase [Planctomycetota bacterium]|nr:MAG: S41 family peptidase [Planctomycetota bacterium]